VRRSIILACAAVGAALSGVAVLPVALASTPGRQIERFTLVIEGKSTAKRTFTETGAVGLCKINVHGTLTETATYLRGRGVTMIAVRGPSGTVFYRTGPGPVNGAITTRVHLVRKATGSVSWTPLVPKLSQFCQHLKGTPDLSKHGCPEHKNSTEDWGFKLSGKSFALRQDDVLTPPGLKHGPGSCGYTKETAGFLTMAHEFPDIPEVGFVPFPAAQVFGRRHAFLVQMTSGNVVDKPKSTGGGGGGLSLKSTVKDSGRTDLLLRFIRLP
jgi:hypothetical protein